MQRVTLKFPSLQALSYCLYRFGIDKPVIDYYNYSFTADLTAVQIEGALECGAVITPDTSDTVIPE